MTIRFQRLIIIIISLILITGALILILNNYKNNIIFFFTPSELVKSKIELNTKIRIGGFVKEGSVKKISNKSNYTSFIVTDNEKDILVEYEGILPDLFRENQGIVAEGIFISSNKIKAKKVFAKHDENYMPASIKKQLKDSNYWNNNYLTEIPNFNAKSLFDENKYLSNEEIENQISIINFFASWCVPCKAEHSLIMEIKRKFPKLNIIGVNYKDTKDDATNFLSENGNPYTFVAIDSNGDIGFEFGVFGLPETYLTNNKGKIIYKYAGPLTKKVIQKEILPNL